MADVAGLDDEELALALHRQLNAPQRRSRASRDVDAIKKKSKKPAPVESSDESSDDEDAGQARNGDLRGKTKSHKHAKPAPLEPHEAAAAAAVKKAASAAAASHCKCFAAGVPWGVLLPKDALKDRQTLANAANTAFERDGVTCKASEIEVIVVTASREVHAFPPPGGTLEEKQRWPAAVKRAQRVYLATPEKSGAAAAVGGGGEKGQQQLQQQQQRNGNGGGAHKTAAAAMKL